jgi:hypothetical protein
MRNHIGIAHKARAAGGVVGDEDERRQHDLPGVVPEELPQRGRGLLAALVHLLKHR